MTLDALIFADRVAGVLSCCLIAATLSLGIARAEEQNGADPSKLASPPPHAIGFPSRDPKLDALLGFRNPPREYGVVPFYWWLGDPLTKERLAWQLDKLAESGGIVGLQVNYAHSDKGGAFYGATYPSDPPLFSPAWWELFTWWAAECNKRGIAVSLSDYTLGVPGQGWWIDEILADDPSMHGAMLEHLIRPVEGEHDLTMEVPENTLSLMAYRVKDGVVEPGSGIDLRSIPAGRSLRWRAPAGLWQVIVVSYHVVRYSVDPLNPKLGPQVVERFFHRFEDHLPGEAGKGLNFFFSDELTFGVSGKLWTERLAEEFAKRKGYDLLQLLPALFVDIGPSTPKIRLDYNDVLVSLTEEAYYKPIFRWHYDRGMLYGCDHGGRGTNVVEFGDYFRTQRWVTGPGCDAPGLSTDVIKDKVASSIAHLYQRPRVWLEGFYGSGWGTSTADLTRATLENFVMGHNLLALHGLYYSTYGGWWEWAPPCNGFRMPYWPHMGEFMQFVKRLSYLLSQGVHRCDVAVMYPVAPVQADMDGREAVETAFGIARQFFDQGLDFDFMDDESRARAEISDRSLQVSGEQYRVLVLPHLSAVRQTTLEQAQQFYRAGGVVIALGGLPTASERAGRDDPALEATIREVFGLTQREAATGRETQPQRNAAGGVGAAFVDSTHMKPRSYPGGFTGRWVWSAEPTQKVYFKGVWHGPAEAKYNALVFCDNEGTIFVNDNEIARAVDYQKGWAGTIGLKDGDVITIDAQDYNDGRATAGLFFALVKDGRTVLSAQDLRYSLARPDAGWRTARDLSGLAKPDPENVHELHRAARPLPVQTIVNTIDASIERDFVPAKPCHVLHRKVGPRDVFMVTRAAGTECFFKARGSVELWEPWTGQVRPLHPAKVTPAGTTLTVPSDGAEAHLIVFAPGEPGPSVGKIEGGAVPTKEIAIDGPWEFELKPTLDNRWGDFRLPASDGVLGAEARQFAYAEEAGPNPGWEKPSTDVSGWRQTTCGFGPRFWRLGPIPPGPDADVVETTLKGLATLDTRAPAVITGREYRWQPYEYSLRYGVEGDPGHQGYHGLKAQVSDDFITLGVRRETMTDTVYEDEPGGGRYYLWTTVLAPRDTRVKAMAGGMAPGGVWLGATKLDDLAATINVHAGATPLLLRYDTAGRGHFALRETDASERTEAYPLAMNWYLMPGVLPFDPRPDETKPAGWYRFTSPPGLQSMTMVAYGRVQAWANGRGMTIERKGRRADGAWEYRLTAPEPVAQAVEVAVRVEQERGYYAGAALPEPIALECGAGQISLGDWSTMGALSSYSGGAWYRKTVTLASAQLGSRLTLDLGAVVATAEVHINGKSAGIRVAAPWQFDISGLAKAGDNRIEVLVYNTLANHYRTIPTRYRGSTTSGLLGPVRILITREPHKLGSDALELR